MRTRSQRLTAALLSAGICLSLAGASYAQQTAPPDPKKATAKPFGGITTKPAPALASVNLNTASVEALQVLSGVGPAKAAVIVAYRVKYGPFKSVDELINVRGFGAKTVAKLKPYLTVGK